MATFNASIAASADDGYYRCEGTGTTFSSSATEVAIGDNNSDGLELGVWMRFTNVTIPQGAIISNAQITVIAIGSISQTICAMKCTAEDVDNATTNPSSAANGRSRTRTTANVTWNQAGQTNNVSYTLPNIATVLQEIIDRPGWASGNAILLFIDGNGSTTGRTRAWAAENHASAAAPAIAVTYTAATTYNETGSGGAVLGGSAAPAMTVTIVVAGAASSGGTATLSVSYSPAAAGQAVAGGTAPPQLTYTLTAAGQAVAGGIAAPQLTYTLTAAGEAVAGGQADVAIGYAGIGGAIAGGIASPTCVYSPAAAGGSAAAGTASPQATYTIAVAGSAVAGGQGAVSQETTLAAAGQAVAGGVAEVAAFYNPPTSGSAVAGGTAAPTQHYTPTAAGGAIAGGTAAPTVLYAIAATGGAVAGGEATIIVVRSTLAAFVVVMTADYVAEVTQPHPSAVAADAVQWWGGPSRPSEPAFCEALPTIFTSVTRVQ